MDRPMTTNEKTALKESIPQLTITQQANILNIVQPDIKNNELNGEVVEFELDMLSVKICREL